MYIDDLTGTLSAAQMNDIQNLTSPFDVKIALVSTESKTVLDAKVSSMVTSANTLAIGIDPVHKYTFTHFGIGTGISRNDFQTVARSGNGEFKQGHWGEGIQTIISSATAARKEARETTTIVMPAQVTHVETAFPVAPVLGGVLALIVGFFFIWRWNKKRVSEVSNTLNDFRNEAQELRSRNIQEQAWHDKMSDKLDKPVTPRTAKEISDDLDRLGTPKALNRPLPKASKSVRHKNTPGLYPLNQPPVIIQNNNNDLLTGVLIGEAISRPAPYYPPPSYTPPPSYNPPRERESNSSSSSWSSSSDSGSSSSWGSGGGDFSGGFDSGGGGGDF